MEISNLTFLCLNNIIIEPCLYLPAISKILGDYISGVETIAN